jgi:chemotaxis protein CheD
MFHAMLPLAPSSTDASMPGKFVDSGIRHVMDNFDKAGVQRSRIRVKLFGGAYSMKDASKEAVRSIVDVGAKNVAVARERLAELGLPVLGEDVLGGQGRKVLFHTGTGDVWVRFLKHMDVDPALFRARTA